MTELKILEKERLHEEAIKDILANNPGPEWHYVRFQNYVTEHKVNYYIFSAMNHVGLIEWRKKTSKNWIRAKMKAEDVQPIHVKNVLEDINKIWAEMRNKKKQTEDVVETAVSKVQKQLEDLQAELQERIKYPNLDKEALEAVRTLQEQGFKVSLEKELKLSF